MPRLPPSGASTYLAGSPGIRAGDPDHCDIPLLRYDVARDNWQTVAPASVMTHRTACVALLGMIYVIGGEDNVNYGLLNRVSRYDPATGWWQHSE